MKKLEHVIEYLEMLAPRFEKLDSDLFRGHAQAYKECVKLLKEVNLEKVHIINECPICGCSEMLCGFPKHCSSVQNEDKDEDD